MHLWSKINFCVPCISVNESKIIRRYLGSVQFYTVFTHAFKYMCVILVFVFLRTALIYVELLRVSLK